MILEYPKPFPNTENPLSWINSIRKAVFPKASKPREVISLNLPKVASETFCEFFNSSKVSSASHTQLVILDSHKSWSGGNW